MKRKRKLFDPLETLEYETMKYRSSFHGQND